MPLRRRRRPLLALTILLRIAVGPLQLLIIRPTMDTTPIIIRGLRITQHASTHHILGMILVLTEAGHRNLLGETLLAIPLPPSSLPRRLRGPQPSMRIHQLLLEATIQEAMDRLLLIW
jgi:hypothetical protein